MDQAERLRKIVNQQEGQTGTARVITITSGKGGVGKTCTTINLAIQISRLGKRVVIFDADFGLANIEVMLGIRPKNNLADLMFNNMDLKDIICDGVEDVKFISGGSGIAELTRINKGQLIYLTRKLRELDNLVDVIIIDTGAGIQDAVIDFVTASNEVILIATPEPTSITDAYALLKTLNRKDDFSVIQTAIKLLANRVTTGTEGGEIMEKLNVVSNKFLDIGLEYLGAIPYDTTVSKSIIKQKPISISHPNSVTVKAYADVAMRLCEDVEITAREKKGFVNLFANLLKSKFKTKEK